MRDTTIRVEAAVLALQRFTIARLCEHTGLRRSQVDPVIAQLKKAGYLDEVVEPEAGTVRPSNRPTGTLKTTSDRVRLQELIDRVYRVRRLMEPDKDSDAAELEAIDARLNGLDLSLEASRAATELRPLSRALLERVEDELREIHGMLERATYRRALDIRLDEHRDHPVVAAWRQWEMSQTRLNKIVDRWEQPMAVSRLGTILSPRAYTVKRLDIVCDPRFIDSALFMWMFHQQPFRQVGVDIACTLVTSNWADIPRTVAENEHAIGFFNREEGNGGQAYDVGYWIDLCVYRGYALLAHPSFGLQQRPVTLTESQEILRQLSARLRDEGRRPKIFHIGHDTLWRFGDKLTPDLPRSLFHWEIEHDANKALEKFWAQKDTFFIGGLPQRLMAERSGAISVLDAGHKPSLYSINGVVFNPALGLGAQAVLQDVSSLWFDTVKRMRQVAYRREVAAEVRRMLEQFNLGGLVFDDEMFGTIFESSLEQFPTSPAEMTRLYEAAQRESLLSQVRPEIVNETMRKPDFFAAELEDSPAGPLIPGLLHLN